MGESMKCGSFRFISHLSPLTSWQSWERLLGEGRGFLGLVLLFGSGLVKNPFRVEKGVLCLQFFKILPVYEGRFIVCIAAGIVQ
jgi:hypothetical protein